MNMFCLLAALSLTLVLCFVSFVQLLYLESLRLLRRETKALEFFREKLAAEIGLEQERGSLAFSLLKHISLILIGVLFLCGLERADAPYWQSVLEAAITGLLAMLVATYFVPFLLYRRTKGEWLQSWLPVVKLLAWLAAPLVGLVSIFQSLMLELDQGAKRRNARNGCGGKYRCLDHSG